MGKETEFGLQRAVHWYNLCIQPCDDKAIWTVEANWFKGRMASFGEEEEEDCNPE